MIALALLVVLAQADESSPSAVEGPRDPMILPAEEPAQNPLIQEAPPEEPVVEAAPVEDPERWTGEAKRVHVAIGLRAHGGLMQQGPTPFLLIQSGMFIGVDVRTFKHQEASVTFELSGSLVDTVVGETLIAYKFHLTPRFSIGAGVILLWGFWSFRGGVEVPFGIRLDQKRKHEIGIAVRATGGVYNNVTYVWWDFERQRPAVTLDGAITYTFRFGS